MYKTKLGISVGLMGAAMYFLGMLGMIPVVLAAGYVLLMEENEWLRITAVKAAAISICIGVLSSIVGLGLEFHSIISNIFGLFKATLDIFWLSRIISIVRALVSMAGTLVLLISGIKALAQGSIKIDIIDKTIRRHMQ